MITSDQHDWLEAYAELLNAGKAVREARDAKDKADVRWAVALAVIESMRFERDSEVA